MMRLELQRNRDALALGEGPGDRRTAEGPKLISARATSERRICVWLIEDNHSFRRTVVGVLQSAEDLDCARHFANSEEALDEMARGTVPDVVLVDIGLPGLNGLEAVSRIKSISPSTRVVMLTVFDDHDKIFRAICAGASGYLLKTSPMERIIESVREAYAGGAPMTPRIARSVLDMFRRTSPPHQDYGLTAREEKILELMTQGLIKKEIGDRLSISY